MTVGKGFVTQTAFKKHLDGNWRTVHELWSHIRNYMVSYAAPDADTYSKTEIDAFFEGYSGGKAQVDAGNVVGLTQGSIPFADASGFLAEDNSNFFWDATNERLAIGHSSPDTDCALHIEFSAQESVNSRVAAKTRPWRQWECLDGNWGLAIGIHADDGKIHLNYDAPIGTRDTSMIVFDGPNARVGILNDAPTYPHDIGGDTRIAGSGATELKVETSGAADPFLCLKTTNTAHEVHFALDESAVADHVDFIGQTAAVDTYLHVIGKAGQTAKLGVQIGAYRGELICGSAGHISLKNITTDKNLVFGIDQDGTPRTITWDAANDKLQHSAGLFNFDDDNIQTSGFIALRSNAEIRFYDNGNYVGFEAPALSGNQIWVLPDADGPANEVLGTDNSGNLIWRDHGEIAGLGDDDHTQYILHSLAGAANDFLVASGANTFVKKTLAETGAILEGDINHDNLVGFAAGEHFTMLDEDNMATDSDTQAATQQSIKAYVDAIPAGSDEKVKVDAAAIAGYLGVAFGDGVLRVTQNELTVADGGNFITLGLADHATARTALGLAIGSDVLAYDAGIQNLAGVAMAANRFYYTSGDNVHVAGVITAAGRALIDDANAGAQRTTLGLVIGTNVLAQQTIGIADNNLIEIDSADVASGRYARFTANGLDGRTATEVLADIGAGNVSAAANITDHAIVRGNGGAKGIQESGILIDDNDVMTFPDGGSIVLQEDITFLGATTENQIKFPDNLPVALSFMEGANPYMTFVSTDDSEAVKFDAEVDLIDKAIATTSKAKAYASANQLNIVNNTWTKVLLDTESYDPGNNFAANKFVARVAGCYLVLAQIKLRQAGLVADKAYTAAIRVNGGVNELTLAEINTSTTPAYPSILVVGVIPLEVDDFLELWFLQSSGGNTVDIRGATEDLTFMQVHLLSI